MGIDMTTDGILKVYKECGEDIKKTADTLKCEVSTIKKLIKVSKNS